MLTAGLSALAGSAASGVWNQVSMENFMQNYFPNYLTTGRNMQADQKLARKYFEIEMRIERQNLHRDDLRDLMELTVGRMDIYHVVGTLILTFCIEWFTNMDFLHADVPEWFRMLFLISNYSAVGYLIFSVWLAMHASIAAHSVGVRLLTSFARLSIPSKEELKKLRVHFVPRVEEFMAIARRFGLLGASQEQPAAAAPTATSAANSSHRQTETRRTQSSSVVSTSVAAGTLQELPQSTNAEGHNENEVDDGTDDRQHFERYTEEQKTWLGYDAYARVCMSLGMNQMLQALSYYIVGMLWQKSLTGAIVTFFGVKGIAFKLLQLDITGMGHDWREYLQVLFFTWVPTICACAGFVVLKHIQTERQWHEDVLRLCVFPCFLLHGIWILYVALDLDFNRRQRCCAPQNAAVPAARSGGLPRRIRTVNYLGVCDDRQRKATVVFKAEEAKVQLEQVRHARERLATAMKHSMAANGGENRDSEEVTGARETLSEAVEAAQLLGAKGSELQAAAEALQRSEIWQQAPKVHAALLALQDESVRGYLSQEQLQAIDESFSNFVKQCHDLGLEVPTARAPLVRVPVAEVAELAHAWGDLPESVWVKPGELDVKWEPPVGDTTTSFATAMTQAADWQARATQRVEPMNIMTPTPEEGPAPHHEPEHPAPEAATPELRKSPLLAPGASPDGSLPQTMVRSFSQSTAFWWVAAGLLHLARTIGSMTSVEALEPLVLGQFQWEHSFFELGSLSCNATHLLLSDHFTTYVGQRQSEGLSSLQEVGEASVATELAWLDGLTLRPGHSLPSEWRLVATAWESPRRIAGWDGSAVVVAAVRLEAGTWQVQPRFRVRGPFVGVRALHLDSRRLAVLLASWEVDIWDLEAGTRVGRWRLPRKFSALCLDGSSLLLARQGQDGPVLELAQLPLTSELHGKRFLEPRPGGPRWKFLEA